MKRIALIENDVSTLISMKNQLTNHGYEIVGWAGNAPKGIELIKATQPDLIILDYELDDNTKGTEVARFVKSCLNIPIIYLTQYQDSHTVNDIGNTTYLSNLALGLHTLTYRFKDDLGLWSVPNTQFFERRELVKTGSDTFRNKVYAFESWIDTSFSSRTQSIRFQSDTLVNLDTLLPLSHLALGLHTLNYRFKDSLNQWSSVMTQFFERRENNVLARVNRITAFEYWIGTQFAQRVTVAVTPDSVLSLDVNRFVSNLTAGVNVFSWRFKDSSGLWSVVVRDTLSAVIPIELLSFDAQLFGQDAHLKWTTASEKNVSTFDIERSTDGINFKAIGEVKAVGNSQTLQKYRFVDKNLRSSQRIYYYRLRIVDRDGTSDYSPIRSVELDTKSPTLTVYPNPTSGSLTVDIQNAKTHPMELVNVLGQSVLKTTLNQEKTDLDLSDLQSGIYFIRVAILVDKIVVTKVIKH